ncbi:2-hydroxy-3-keto-5-methylthiopentenyl-1-phosphate phosphatase [Desmospora activa]|uniref:2-hydroxy-3-keto-5-methylthiopentenyl-1-phosphate phosphatase n=1 Tax=Desmospora activa DSM 45169 TaxID=1121389 RepID=A0A2T4Z1P0_9BACL|nr:2-hydroxy-3-keto-5-methylthiopentenyl-1-phosphate phosphatase [Desmospora activa]PTM54689.1 2-hydroxy-3-keto-5-methylthiopentenyl-1-phosphate phosphatase [Desmospora activa DSM 45169]
MNGTERVLFCDFDGTITTNDNIIRLLRQENPSGWEGIKDDVLARRISIREGVGRMFSLIPSQRREALTRFVVEGAEIRPGFQRFLTYCRSEGIRLLITSGGIDFFVYPILEPFGIPQEDIFCNGSDFSGETVRITWPHSCDRHCDGDCGMCKTTIMRRFPAAERIVIGDSVTDLAGAQLADWVIARDYLLDRCREQQLPHRPFETFDDVIAALEAHAPVKGGMTE